MRSLAALALWLMGSRPYPTSRGAHARTVARLMSCTYCGGSIKKNVMRFPVAVARSGAPFPRPSNKPSVECKMMPADEDYVPISISMSKPGHWDISGSPVIRLCKSLFRRRVYKSLPQLDFRRSAAQTRTVSTVRFRGNSPNLSRQRRRISVLSDIAVRILHAQPRSQSPLRRKG